MQSSRVCRSHLRAPTLTFQLAFLGSGSSVHDDRLRDDRVGDDWVGDDRVGDDRVGDDRRRPPRAGGSTTGCATRGAADGTPNCNAASTAPGRGASFYIRF